MSDKHEGRFLTDAAPVLLRRALLWTSKERRLARLELWLSAHDPELRPLLPSLVREAYKAMEAKAEIRGMDLELEYEDQTVELGPWPGGAVQVKESGCRLMGFTLKRKKVEGNFRINLIFKLEMDADRKLGAWLADNAGTTVLLLARAAQPSLPLNEDRDKPGT